jgi:hypothetical protein
MEDEIKSREIILVDKTRDPRLQDIVARAEQFLQPFPDFDIKVRMLAMYVSNLMGGSQIDDIAPGMKTCAQCIIVTLFRE